MDGSVLSSSWRKKPLTVEYALDGIVVAPRCCSAGTEFGANVGGMPFTTAAPQRVTSSQNERYITRRLYWKETNETFGEGLVLIMCEALQQS